MNWGCSCRTQESIFPLCFKRNYKGNQLRNAFGIPTITTYKSSQIRSMDFEALNETIWGSKRGENYPIIFKIFHTTTFSRKVLTNKIRKLIGNNGLRHFNVNQTRTHFRQWLAKKNCTPIARRLYHLPFKKFAILVYFEPHWTNVEFEGWQGGLKCAPPINIFPYYHYSQS